MNTHSKPRIVVSRCLGFDPCRYNGEIISNPVVAALSPHVEFVQVCPEVEIGLGTPRPPVRIVSGTDGFRLMQPSSGAELTSRMHKFSAEFLGNLGAADGFVLTHRSPSCGVGDAKVYKGIDTPASIGKTSGLFAAAVLERFLDAAVEDDGRLNNRKIREHFLTRVFAYARLRQVKVSRSVHELVRFHAAHKLLLMAYGERSMRELGRIVANADRRNAPAALSEYKEKFHRGLATAPRHAAHVNVLMHAFGYFSRQLSAKEKRHFLGLLESYRRGKTPLIGALWVMRAWMVRFERPYLQEQAYFQPFPDDLAELDDSGKRRPLRQGALTVS